ncbi:helix-turn-helix domain-containing protein [Anaerosinus gibii]|uniref:Helix-turn-helix transcriptional regulator n=1 Tax=Selenobaculum gibii TaxID=3054208 RepID=A0A9Y2ETX2_9FIRM|nr:helix-turn-helix transcriptional regulator [Selenobaculum gbiensis]WIW70640.1 helix-turn-helix transcriptional regulator [Selenobaculum gbiensis]
MQITNENKIIIDRIRDLRIKNGLSQAKFAQLINVSSGNVGSWETYKTLPGAIALKNIALKLECSLDWLILGNEEKKLILPEQKNEVIFDPELKRMIDILKELMTNENPHMRSWAIIQFEKAFSEVCATYDEKKQHA